VAVACLSPRRWPVCVRRHTPVVGLVRWQRPWRIRPDTTRSQGRWVVSSGRLRFRRSESVTCQGRQARSFSSQCKKACFALQLVWSPAHCTALNFLPNSNRCLSVGRCCSFRAACSLKNATERRVHVRHGWRRDSWVWSVGCRGHGTVASFSARTYYDESAPIAPCNAGSSMGAAFSFLDLGMLVGCRRLSRRIIRQVKLESRLLPKCENYAWVLA
jgi:hypothetical protein